MKSDTVKLRLKVHSPIRELVALLDVSAPSQDKTHDDGQAAMGSALKETVCRLSAATDMTRVSAILLWALLAIVKHRIEDLVRLDNALMFFMQIWQDRVRSATSVVFAGIPVGISNVPYDRQSNKLIDGS